MLNLLNYLNFKVKSIVYKEEATLNEAVEIRLRINSPVLIKTVKKSLFLDKNNTINKKDIDDIVSNFTKYSIHAFENEISNGYLTIEGGHRVGIGGDIVYDKNGLKTFKNITSLNIRIAREFPGCSNKIIKYFITPDKNIYNSLIIGQPLSGKTTIVRDIAKNLSNGIKYPYFEGCDITLIDERGEISAVYNGVPQMDTGKRTDVLSYCKKSDGFFMSIRSLSPKVIISDELGSVDDFEIIQYALKSGVKIITTAHGFSLEDVQKNIYLRNIIKNNFFERAFVLDKNPLKVQEVFDFQKNKVVYNDNG